MVLPREELLGAITILDEDGTGFVTASDAEIQDVSGVNHTARALSPGGDPTTGASKGAFWVEDTGPTLPKFTDSAGTTITLGGNSSDLLFNDSSVAGTTISDALNNLFVGGGGDETLGVTLFLGNTSDGYDIVLTREEGILSSITTAVAAGSPEPVQITGGTSTGATGGAITITSGAGLTDSGFVTIQSNGGSGTTGGVTIRSQYGGTTTGPVTVESGAFGSSTTGDLFLNTGRTTTGSSTGDVRVNMGWPGGGAPTPKTGSFLVFCNDALTGSPQIIGGDGYIYAGDGASSGVGGGRAGKAAIHGGDMPVGGVGQGGNTGVYAGFGRGGGFGGYLELFAGDSDAPVVSPGLSGYVEIRGGNVSTAGGGAAGRVRLLGGNTTSGSAAGGDVILTSGTGFGGFASGAIQIATAGSNGAGDSASVSIDTGDALTSGGSNSGHITLTTGNANGNQGDIILDAGTALTWPTADGTAGQAMVTDGAGNLSFDDVSGGIDVDTVVTSTPTTIADASSAGYRLIPVDTSASGTNGPATINLPTTPVDGERIVIKDYGREASISNITVGRNGNTIDNDASDDVISDDRAAVTYIWDATLSTWLAF